MNSVPDFKNVFLALKKLCSNVLYLKKNDEGGIVIRSDMRELSDLERFLDLYETLTHTKYNVLETKHMTRYVYRKRWFCHFRRKTKPELNLECRASIDILVKKLTRNTLRNDPFLKLKPPLLSVIKIRYTHNHPVLEKKFLRKNKMTNEVKKIFYEYFKRDIVGMNAKKFHLKLLREIKFPYMDDRCINPCLSVIYRLHRFWLKEVAPKDNIQADPALEKEDGSFKLENIKQEEDSCHDEFVNHAKEMIVRVTSFPEEPSVDNSDAELFKAQLRALKKKACKDTNSTESDCTENKNTAQDFIRITDVLGNATEIGNEQGLSSLNLMGNRYRPIMPKPVPGKTNSKTVVPANSTLVSASVNPIFVQRTDVFSQKPILISKYGLLKVNAIMIQNIKS